MAHEIAQTVSGENMFATVRKNATDKEWHGLGQTIVRKEGHFATKEEILEASKLKGFTLEQVPCLMESKGEMVYIEGKSVIRRSDNHYPISVMGEGFEIVQAEQLAEFAETIIGESGAYFDTGGALLGGSTFFFSLKLPSTIMGWENLGKSLIVATANDGTMATLGLASLTRPVCNNTLTSAIKGTKNKVSIRHTKNWKNRVEEARRVLCITQKHYEEIEKAFESLRTETINKDYASKFINNLFPATSKKEGKIPKQTEEVREKVMELFVSGKGNEGKTKWDLFNGVTEYIDHHTRGRITTKSTYRTDSGNSIEDEQRFMRINFGQGSRLRQDAFDMLVS